MPSGYFLRVASDDKVSTDATNVFYLRCAVPTASIDSALLLPLLFLLALLGLASEIFSNGYERDTGTDQWTAIGEGDSGVHDSFYR